MAAMDNLQRHHVVLDSAAHSKSELIKSIAESEERITTKISESEKRVRKTTRSWGLAATGSALVVTIIILIHSRE
jgi:putative ribosome biogenesis GTPase RsgA